MVLFIRSCFKLHPYDRLLPSHPTLIKHSSIDSLKRIAAPLVHLSELSIIHPLTLSIYTFNHSSKHSYDRSSNPSTRVYFSHFQVQKVEMGFGFVEAKGSDHFTRGQSGQKFPLLLLGSVAEDQFSRDVMMHLDQVMRHGNRA